MASYLFILVLAYIADLAYLLVLAYIADLAYLLVLYSRPIFWSYYVSPSGLGSLPSSLKTLIVFSPLTYLNTLNSIYLICLYLFIHVMVQFKYLACFKT